MRVYIAGPLNVSGQGSGDVQENIKNALILGKRVLEAGHFPYIPHLNWFFHQAYPQDRGTWVTLDLAFLGTCQAIIRLPGISPGSDDEWTHAGELGIKRFVSFEQFQAFYGE